MCILTTAAVHATACCAAINQFNKTLDKNAAETLFKLLLKYRPETKTQKRTRLLSEAEAREAGKVCITPHLTDLVP